MTRKEHNPWYYAGLASRGYITPEDIRDARLAGADKSYLQNIVLKALGRKACEDWSLCAFVASHYRYKTRKPKASK